MLTTLQIRKFFLISNLNLHCCLFKTMTSCPFPADTEQLIAIFLIKSLFIRRLFKIPTLHICSRLPNPGSSIFSSLVMISRLLKLFVTLVYRFSFSIFFFNIFLETWCPNLDSTSGLSDTQGLTSAE